MSHIIYGQNKIICHVDLPEELIRKDLNKFLRVNQLVLIVHHFQYPSIFYQKIFNHFKHALIEGSNYLKIRLVYNSKQLPSNLPIGLFIQNPQNEGYLQVKISQYQISEPQKILKQSLKQAFSSINPNRGCNYFYRQINHQQQQGVIQKYINGQSHDLQNQQFQGYEGTMIAIRFLIQGQLMERKHEASQHKTIKDLISEQIPQLNDKKYIVKSHGVDFNLEMPVKRFLDQWSYNDGYCYLKIDQA